MEPYLINPVSRKAGTIRRKNMAKRNKKGQYVKKAGKKAKKVRKSHKVVKAAKTRKTKHRKTASWTVKSYKAKARTVRRHKAMGRKQEWLSNPIMGDVTQGLIMAGVFFGALFAVGFIGKQAEKLPLPQTRFTPLLTKLGVALAAVWGVRELSRRGVLSYDHSKVAVLAAFAPLGMSILSTVAPGAAAQISLAGDMGAELNGYLPQDLGMSMAPGGRGRISDYTISAELNAELEAESESGSF